jgi:methionyl-tRNA formyltransferase
MKALLVTSEITYVPGNYLELFEEIFKQAPETVGGLLILKVLDLRLAARIAGLALAGAPRMALTLARNAWALPRRRRERLFEERGLPVRRARSVNDPEVLAWIRAQGFELVVNLRTRCIYRQEALRLPRLGCVNVHHGILPRHRGTLCDLQALREGRAAGFSIHRMNERLDDGEILHVEETSAAGERDYLAHLARASRLEGAAVARLLRETASRGSLPEGRPNQCDAPVHSRTPFTRSELRRFRQAGLRL